MIVFYSLFFRLSPSSTTDVYRYTTVRQACRNCKQVDNRKNKEWNTSIIKLQSFLYRRRSRPMERTEKIRSWIRSLSHSKVLSTWGFHAPVLSSNNVSYINFLLYSLVPVTSATKYKYCTRHIRGTCTVWLPVERRPGLVVIPAVVAPLPYYRYLHLRSHGILCVYCQLLVQVPGTSIL